MNKISFFLFLSFNYHGFACESSQVVLVDSTVSNSIKFFQFVKYLRLSCLVFLVGAPSL